MTSDSPRDWTRESETAVGAGWVNSDERMDNREIFVAFEPPYSDRDTFPRKLKPLEAY
jgi:hypothetical protein